MQARVSRSKAIRLKCLDCCCGQSAEVRKCPAIDCPLWLYSIGREIRDDESTQNSSTNCNDFEDEDFE